MKRSLNYPGAALLFAALLLWGSGASYVSSAEAAEKSKLVVRLDFIVGGNMPRGSSLGKKASTRSVGYP